MRTTRDLAVAAVIAGAYAGLTLALTPLSFGPVQVRVAEAMCVLPLLFPQAVAGLTAGCFLANLIGLALGGTVPPDLAVGTLATLFAALLTLRCRRDWLAPAFSVVLNGVLVGGMITLCTLTREAWLTGFALNALTVAGGEVIAAYGLGIPLLTVFRRNPRLKEIVSKYAKGA